MDIFVRDLVAQLNALPPEARVRFMVVCLDGSLAEADDWSIKRGDDGVQELKIFGALVKQIVSEQEPEHEVNGE